MDRLKPEETGLKSLENPLSCLLSDLESFSFSELAWLVSSLLFLSHKSKSINSPAKNKNDTAYKNFVFLTKKTKESSGQRLAEIRQALLSVFSSSRILHFEKGQLDI